MVNLRKQLAQSESVEASSAKYLNQIKNIAKPANPKVEDHSLEDDLDKYISQDNLASLDQNKHLL